MTTDEEIVPAEHWVSITRGGRPGPWHRYTPQRMGWCGSRLTGFNKRHSDKPAEGEPVCQGCTTAIAKGQQRSWRRH